MSKIISQNRLNQQNWIIGIDVSKHNQSIDWNKVKHAGVEFAFIKVTEGHCGENSYDRNSSYNPVKRANEALKNGVKIGYYHFARPGNIEDVEQDAIKEAQNFITHLNQNDFPKPNFPLVIDIEAYSTTMIWQADNKLQPPTKTQTEKYINAFINCLEKNNYKSIIYISPSFIQEHLPQNHIFKSTPLWIANYRDAEINMPAIVNGWGDDWKIWQFSEKGNIDGINGDCDLNVMKKSFFENY